MGTRRNFIRHAWSAVVAASFAQRALAAREDASHYDASRDASADLAHAVARAAQENKLVLVEVGGDWCIWCHILDRFIGSHEDVRAAMERRFVRVKVNFSPANRNERVLSAWPKVAGYPHLFVLDGAGRLVRSQATGEFESGGSYDERRLLAFFTSFG